MKRNLIETILGAVVLFIAIFFVVTTYRSSGVSKDYGTKLFATFDKVDGITTGSDVRVGGIKIGSVIGLTLDPKTYRARLDIGVQNNVGVPTDSSAVIASDGLLGGKYVNVVPGADAEMLKNGGQIEFTQSSVNLEEMIGKFAFGSAGSGAAGAGASTPAAAASNPPPIQDAPAPILKPAPVVPTAPPAAKANVVDVPKTVTAPAPAGEEPEVDVPQVTTPKADAVPAPVTITPKIVKVPVEGQ